MSPMTFTESGVSTTMRFERGADFIQADTVWYRWVISRNGLSGSEDQGLAKGQ